MVHYQVILSGFNHGFHFKPTAPYYVGEDFEVIYV